MIIDEVKKFAEKFPAAKQEGTASLLMCGSIWTEGFCGKGYFSNYKSFQPGWFWLFNKNHGLHLGDERTIPSTCEEQFLLFVKNKKTKVLQRYFAAEKAISKEYELHIKENVSLLPEKQLRKKLLKISALANNISSASIFSEGMTDQMLKKYYFEFGGNEKKFELFLSLAKSPTFESIGVRRDRLKLKFAQQKKSSFKSIQWVYSDYYSSKTVDEIKALLGVMDTKSLVKEIASNEKVIFENKKRFAQVKFFSEKIRRLADFSQLCMRLRDQRRDFFSKAETILFNYAREYFSRIGLNPSDAIYSYYLDFETKINPVEYASLIEKRKKGVLVYLIPGKKLKQVFEYCDFDEARNEIMCILDSKSLQGGEINGQIASRGIATGRAVVILTASDFHKFKAGDVIVASMTRPEYVPLMKQASAIVTDEGGVTCHAAIISRELAKPCITGTKNATRLLKEGDLVEVDANKGVVRKL